MIAITADSTRKSVRTSRWNLNYHEAGSGPVVIMLHGSAPGSNGWSNFRTSIGPLSRNFRVILMDQPGWGDSDTNDNRNESRDEINAQSVKLLMDELGIDKAALVGNSMGGATTQYFAIAYPDRMSHFITMGAGRGGPTIGIPTKSSGSVSMQAYEAPSYDSIKRGCENMVFDPAVVTEDVIEMRLQNCLKFPEHLTNFLANRPKHTGAEMLANMAKLATLKVPALLMHGRDDRVVPCEHSVRMAGVIPNARLLVFNQCGHWVQIERAAEFNAAVESFLLINQ